MDYNGICIYIYVELRADESLNTTFSVYMVQSLQYITIHVNIYIYIICIYTYKYIYICEYEN